MRRRPWLVALAVGACRGDARTPAVAVTSGEPARVSSTPDAGALDDINALVPPALRSRLTFEPRLVSNVDRGRALTYRVAAPTQWRQSSPEFASLTPEPAPAPPAMIFMSLDRKCNGGCSPKPWAEASAEVDFRDRPDETVVLDRLEATHHLRIAKDTDGSISVTYAWWTPDAINYYVCGAYLEDGLQDAAQAFAKACERAEVVRDEPAAP